MVPSNPVVRSHVASYSGIRREGRAVVHICPFTALQYGGGEHHPPSPGLGAAYEKTEGPSIRLKGYVLMSSSTPPKCRGETVLIDEESGRRFCGEALSHCVSTPRQTFGKPSQSEDIPSSSTFWKGVPRSFPDSRRRRTERLRASTSAPLRSDFRGETSRANLRKTGGGGSDLFRFGVHGT
jgi:hypothetical protein